MESMLGFQIGLWDYVTFVVLLTIVILALTGVVYILGLPGRIAISRNHPEAEAVNLMAWCGFLAVVPWIQALIWAFKPTDVIDIRNLPEERRRETEKMIKRMKNEGNSKSNSSKRKKS